MIRLAVFSPGPWACGRTCTPGHACRFTAILAGIGVTQKVVSHTVKVTVEYKDPKALQAAVERLGGRWLGEGTHRLFQGSNHTGLAFHLAGWRYPCILEANGSLAFDNYNGAWGKQSDLDALKGAYAVEAALAVAEAQGWQFERAEDGTAIVYHPAGGTLKVSGAGVEGAGFCGAECASPAEMLAAAMGAPTESMNTADYYAEHNRLHTQQG